MTIGYGHNGHIWSGSSRGECRSIKCVSMPRERCVRLVCGARVMCYFVDSWLFCVRCLLDTLWNGRFCVVLFYYWNRVRSRSG